MQVMVRNQSLLRWLGFIPSHYNSPMFAEMSVRNWLFVIQSRVTAWGGSR